MDRVHGSLWTSHLTLKGYAISTAHSRSNGIDAKEQKVTSDDGSHGGAMASMTGSRRYGTPVRKNKERAWEGSGAHRELMGGVHGVRDGLQR